MCGRLFWRSTAFQPSAPSPGFKQVEVALAEKPGSFHLLSSMLLSPFPDTAQREHLFLAHKNHLKGIQNSCEAALGQRTLRWVRGAVSPQQVQPGGSEDRGTCLEVT